MSDEAVMALWWVTKMVVDEAVKAMGSLLQGLFGNAHWSMRIIHALDQTVEIRTNSSED